MFLVELDFSKGPSMALHEKKVCSGGNKQKLLLHQLIVGNSPEVLQASIKD
jgi:hypothetical protein